ncbi:MAG: hypothetical protein V3V00_12415 [Saprospiraceae bacterium]
MKILVAISTYFILQISYGQIPIEGEWHYPPTGTMLKIQFDGTNIIADGVNENLAYVFKFENESLYSEKSINGLFLNVNNYDTIIVFSAKSKKKNVWIKNKTKDAFSTSENALSSKSTGETLTTTNSKVAQPSNESNIQKLTKFNVPRGTKVYWTENETYKTESSGSTLSELFLGGINNSTYKIEYIGIVEQFIGDNVKLIITDVGIDDPDWASMNYLDSKAYVKEKAKNRIGQTRVKSLDQVEL